MQKEQILIKSDALKLHAQVYKPASIAGDLPVLCFCHGIPARSYDASEKGYEALAEYFCHKGFTGILFSFRGAGLSEGDFDILGWASDLARVIDYIKADDELKTKKVVTIGFSGGAAVSIYAASWDKRISAVAALACPANFDFFPWVNIEQIIRHFHDIGIIKSKGFPLSPDTWKNGFSEISPIKFIDRISPRPLLLVHGSKDETVPLQHALDLIEKAKEPKRLDIIPDAGHRLRLDSRAVECVLNWLLGESNN